MDEDRHSETRINIGSGSLRAFICGGNWNNGGNAGVFYLNGNNSRGNTNTNIGFRSALPQRQIWQTQGFAFSTRVYKGIRLLCRERPAVKFSAAKAA